MTKPLELTVVYSDAGFGEALASEPLELPSAAEEPTSAAPVRVPGAMGGWFELAVNLGVLSFPAGVLAGCIANWITAAVKSRVDNAEPSTNATPHKAKLVLERDGRSVEVELTSNDTTALADAIRNALDRVDPE